MEMMKYDLLEYGNIEIWNYGNNEIWKYGNMKYENMET